MNQNPSMAGLASLVQSRGRNGDTMLVHMTPDEVHGLQRLALAHGGSLTLNPDTGLYEANFLKKLLPTILGFGLNFLIPGLGALGSGLLVGAGETIRTGGDLGKGLMAGLGAFGGAGLGSSLAGIGAASSDAATKMLTQEAVAGAGKDVAAKVAQETAANQVKQQMANQAAANLGSTGARFANLGTGIKNAVTGLKEVATGGQGLGLSGFGGAQTLANVMPGGIVGLSGAGMGIANAMTPDFQLPDASGQIDDSYYEGGDYDPATGTFKKGQWRKGYPGFPGYAQGGVLPRPNYDYPQAGITKSSYAPQLEYARPQEILDGYEVKLDPFTGEEKFADGGPVGVSPGAVGDPRLVLEPGPVISPTLQPQQPQALPPQQSLEQYYQSLLSAPQQQTYNPAFFDYMQSLNRYVTSPVAPPPPPPAPPPPPPPPGGGTTTSPGGGTTTPPGGGGGWRWDPDKGGLVNDNGDMFDPSSFNFGDILSGNFNFGPSDGRMTFDPVTGTFRQSGSQTVTTPPGTDMTGGDQFKFDPNNFQFNPFVDGFDYTSLPGYQQNQNPYISQDMPVGDLTNIDQFADPNYSTGMQFGINRLMQPGRGPDPGGSPMYSGFDFAGGTQGFDMGNVPLQDFSGLGQMGDMGGYGQQFQGFQPLPTDFGSTYQPPAMMAPSLDMTAYSQQPMDFGSMGNYGLGALGTTYQAPAFQMPSYDFSAPAPDISTASFQAPMTTGMDSTAATAPQFGFGNSDVLYGQSMLGGNEPNIFGFAEGGAIQKAAAGKLVTGDGDGMSDDIRANINGDQEARLADGEFVIPADVVSHLGNGSTDAGADRLYSMMDRIRKARTGRTRQAPEIEAEKYLPA